MTEPTPSMADLPLLENLALALEAFLDYRSTLGEPCPFCEAEHEPHCPFTHARAAVDRYQRYEATRR